MTLLSLPALVRAVPDRLLFHRLLLGGMSFITAYVTSISLPTDEAILLPGFAVCLALLLDDLASQATRSMRRVLLVCASCLGLMALAGWHKFNTPYMWGYWIEPPIYRATLATSLPELKGFRLSVETKEFFEDVTRLIERYSTEDDTILVYPHMMILYGLAQRRPATFAYVHWVDTRADPIARQDARRILEQPPAVIVHMELSEEIYLMMEAEFRGGRRSGQRDLVEAIDKLVKDYQLVGEFSAPGTGFPIKVWARKREIGVSR